MARDGAADVRRIVPYEESFRLLVEQVSDYAIFMLDRDGRVATWNAGAQRIKGYTADEIIGQPYERFFPPESADQARQLLMQAEREGRAVSEGWRVRKDGSRFWALANLTALHDPKTGELIGFAKVTRDLTERRDAELARVKLAEERARREAANRVVELLTRLHGLASAIVAVRSPEDLGAVFVQGGAAAVGARAAMFFRPGGQELELVSSLGAEPVDEARTRAATACRTRTAFWLDADDGRLGVLPLVLGERVLGVLIFWFSQERDLAPEERAVLQTWADQAAQALDRTDVLARERAVEERVRALQASLSTTLFSIGDAVIATDARGDVTFMNPVAESLTGWREREARGRHLATVFRIVNEHTRQPVPSPVDKVLATGSIVGLANHTMLISRDGREISIDDSGAPIRKEGGAAIEGVVLVFRDVTAAKRAERREGFLAAATARLSESLDYDVTLGRVAKLAVAQIADWCAIDVAGPGETRPRRLATARAESADVPPDGDLGATYPPALETRPGIHQRPTGCGAIVVPLVGRQARLGTITLVTSESSRRYTEEDLRFAEELAHRCAVAIENARLYAAERRARRSADVANRSKDEFLAMVSHELRTPLNAIVGWAKLLGSASLAPEKQPQAIETIERNAAAMAQLIEDLLDMSRVVSGKLRLDVQPLDLGSTVELAVRSIQPAADAKQIVVHKEIGPLNGRFVGDPNRLQQVVWNLLSNAVKFTPRRGRVDVTVRSVDSAIEIAVRDTGQGIAKEFLPHVFEPFSQQDAGVARGRGGLGLGLAITRQLVELHGGRVNVHSEGPGLGSTFTVTLPILAVAPAEASDSNAPPTPYECPEHVRGTRVLMVDDEPDARNLVRTVLEGCGCEVVEATDVAEAIEAFERAVPDVLVSDIGMPERTGIDLIRHVRGLPAARGGDVPAVALTAFARPEDRRQLLNAGFSMHVPKPVEPSELVAVIASLTRFRRT